MPIPEKYTADFFENGIYHIYNRTNNKEALFHSDENRFFFLKKYKEFLSPYVHTYCWCLLPNHFHLLIRVKSEKEILSFLSGRDKDSLSETEKKFLLQKCTLSELVEQAFKRFFQSYSLSFNKVHQRCGNLFTKPFRRVAVDKEAYFTQAIVYIHANPLKHKLVKDFTNYEWSSWKSYLTDKETLLLKNEVLTWFGNKEQFIKAHIDLVRYYYDSNISIEE